MFTSSSSEVDAFLDCQRKHYYGYALGLEGKTGYTGALSHGNLGHRVWESYYTVLQEGGTWEEAYNAGVLRISSEYRRGIYEAKSVGIVSTRFAQYTEDHRVEDFDILGVEQTFKVPIDADNELAFTVDLLIEFTKGPFIGEVAPLDFKWTYNFWPDDEKLIHPQFPKYVWGLRQIGYPVNRAIIDMIRYREDATVAFRRDSVPITLLRADKVMEEHLKAQKQVSRLTRMPVREYDLEATSRYNRKNCSSCEFFQLCNMRLSGKDTTKTQVSFYKGREYGYR